MIPRMSHDSLRKLWEVLKYLKDFQLFPDEVTALRQGSSNPTATPATSDPNAMEIDASRQGPNGRSRDDFTQAMRGRCYGCGLRTHTKKDCKHNKTQCNHCKRYGHLIAVCQDRFMGLEKDRGLSRNTQRVRATTAANEAAFDICTGQPIYNSHATIAASTTTASPSVSAPTPATPAAPNDFSDLQTIQQNQLRILSEMAKLKEGF